MTNQGRNGRFLKMGCMAVLAELFAMLLLTLTILAPSAQAQTYTVIHSFSGLDGANPRAGLTIDGAGNLYGITNGGGAGYGMVFKVTEKNSAWLLNPLYKFTGGSDGAGSRSRVTFGRDGRLYGATIGGGVGCGGTGCGTVFALQPLPTACKTALCYWSKTPLYTFTGGTDGALPYADLTFDQAGNIYGGAYRGGNGVGVIYELSRSQDWAESVLYAFTGGNDGNSPLGGVIFDGVGNLYGTTVFGGPSQDGVVFQLTHSGSGWTENTLYSFQGGLDGSLPVAGVILDTPGNLYGASQQGGSGGGGVVFELPNNVWNFTGLNSLSGNGECGPQASLVMDQAGNLYGTTYCDGMFGFGSVFELTPSDGGQWMYHSLYNFMGGQDGANSWSTLVFDRNGNIYGTAENGGIFNTACPGGCGVVFKITPN